MDNNPDHGLSSSHPTSTLHPGPISHALPTLNSSGLNILPSPFLMSGSHSRTSHSRTDEKPLLARSSPDKTSHLQQPKHPYMSSTGGFITLLNSYQQSDTTLGPSLFPFTPDKLLPCLKEVPLISQLETYWKIFIHSLLYFLSCTR